MRQVETTGRTVEEAVGRAAGELGVERDDVDVEIVDPGARGMLGLGAREARVRVTLKGNPGAIAHTVMARLLQEMGLPGTVRV
ncbi:MAG: protein jag, partial [Bacillati bacterium ANGP1]